jgi:hypothetical protein
MQAGEREMSRLLIAAVFVTMAAAPAFACPWSDTVSTDAKPSTVAAQPTDDHGTPPPATPADQKPS